MSTQDITDTIDSLESFLAGTSKKLNKKQQNELKTIIARLHENRQHPDREELIQLAILIFKIMMQGAELIQHHHR